VLRPICRHHFFITIRNTETSVGQTNLTQIMRPCPGYHSTLPDPVTCRVAQPPTSPAHASRRPPTCPHRPAGRPAVRPLVPDAQPPRRQCSTSPTTIASGPMPPPRRQSPATAEEPGHRRLSRTSELLPPPPRQIWREIFFVKEIWRPQRQ
jgi:hypothetical protein